MASKYFVNVAPLRKPPSKSAKYVRKSLPKPIREMIWRKKFGTSLDAMCPICNKNQICVFRFHVGHIVAVAKGGSNELSNLCAICDACNLSAGIENMEDFCKYFVIKPPVNQEEIDLLRQENIDNASNYEFEVLRWQTENDTLRTYMEKLTHANDDLVAQNKALAQKLATHFELQKENAVLREKLKTKKQKSKNFAKQQNTLEKYMIQ